MRTPNELRLLATLVSLTLLAGCGSWAGNPKDDDDDDDEDPQVIAGGGGGAGGGLNYGARPGGAMIQKVSLTAGQPFRVGVGFSGAGFRLAAANDQPLELSIVRADGEEVAYTREKTDASAVGWTPDETGDYYVVVKNDTDQTLSVASTDVTGASWADQLLAANNRPDAVYASVALKAVLVLAKNCKQYANGGMSVDTKPAPDGEYYVQPFVFYGEVDGSGKVTPLAGASISIRQGAREQKLTRLNELPLSVYKELSGLTQEQHAAYTTAFYQGYFGAAGELYTTAYSFFPGDCSGATTFAIGADAGRSELQLVVQDASRSPALDQSFSVRPTVSANFSTYTSADAKLSDWTQCTYDRVTGQPKTYNGDATTCKTFSLADPPYVTLDYELPSDASPGTVSKASDPTRILYYGHSFAKAWVEALITDADALASGAKDTVALPGCLSNGGLVPVPISAEKTYLPLGEMSMAVDDVVNLARRTGSYTALTSFHQGNADVSGELTFPTCLPKDGQACGAYATVKVQRGACAVKADSGISVTSVGDSMVYPSYFEMSGVVTP